MARLAAVTAFVTIGFSADYQPTVHSKDEVAVITFSNDRPARYKLIRPQTSRAKLGRGYLLIGIVAVINQEIW